MMKMDCLSMAATILVVIGGINCGLVGALNIDVITMLFGVDSWLTKCVYSLFGLAAVYMVYTLCAHGGCAKIYFHDDD